MSDSPAWNDELLNANPHTAVDKRSRVQKMFAAIAPSYDLNNRLHSFWRDQAWRRTAVRLASLKPDDRVVDVACGTGDLALAMHTGLWPRHGEIGPARGQVIGVDFTFEMLPRAVEKSQVAGQPSQVHYINGDATALPLPDACCDVVSIAFGIRNVQEPDKALREFRRILRPGGRVIVLEFSEPTNPLIRSLNRLYTGKIMPITATMVSGDKSGAYKYLPKSIGTFWSREKMVQMLTEAGFVEITQRAMTFGVCICYRGMLAPK
ncbi:MAG TPA: bifunctional demethylmenaquinone methyltransferase/2-methoxy-6-polyprenyl-1,4-benzoquinol methylase UbiE [Tepidisphaeraceae bacterium]|nr:bifunctional demethylmenaquinone methyltransferase/2-methoxy-6-polyprenyl-1,4-benzoquinol methylase UbiE [Tepidisphaeraceae bacterium]